MFSETVGNALMLTGGDEVKETVKFVSLFDDMLNVRNFTSGTKNRKPFQHPYRHENDFRLAVSTSSMYKI